MRFNRQLFKEAFKAGYKRAKRLNESLENVKLYLVWDNDTIKSPAGRNEVEFELPFEGFQETIYDDYLDNHSYDLNKKGEERERALEELRRSGIKFDSNEILLPCSEQEFCEEYIDVCNRAIQKASRGKCPKISFCELDSPYAYNYRNDDLFVKADKSIRNFDVEDLILRGLNCSKDELPLVMLDEMDMNWLTPDYKKAQQYL